MVLVFYPLVKLGKNFFYISYDICICLYIFVNFCRININMEYFCIFSKLTCISHNPV